MGNGLPMDKIFENAFDNYQFCLLPREVQDLNDFNNTGNASRIPYLTDKVVGQKHLSGEPYGRMISQFLPIK